MANRTVNIGLSLGADICWPICYETLLSQMDLDMKIGGDRVRVACERVTIEPFDLRQPVKYVVVIDRQIGARPVLQRCRQIAVARLEEGPVEEGGVCHQLFFCSQISSGGAGVENPRFHA